MQYGIQRRSIYLAPPDEADLAWIFELFETDQQIWSMFGFAGPSRALMIERHATGNLVVGVIRRVESRRRIGFIVCFPPPNVIDAWEFSFAIPDPTERDGWSAISAADAVGHYMFEHLKIERGSWRIKEDNAPSNAVARRIGYRPFGSWEIDGVRYNFYRIDHARWMARRERLDRGEEEHPSGIGDTFLTLLEAPYSPVVPEVE